ncbi:hypothetical protein DV113_002936 [Geotrichum candidum]|uniref:Similar to Saccharomyces cerevisiae YOR120W GCY1 Glycerol dehydrogenase, involved in an alternative pathway for glycerol catabolism used under microaerobic conditions n=1 Tax=Geotrichum candidum TaxID=1173061 RepID=A0A0J9X2Z0_GEOCN|nr:hypothetical protein DV113_002936 [Geotrichum candidum]CDO51466.1 similar to Saccharomyces cerevisiae YOR120W GCY1 Glycerol dehydrogenase, involved in an alternative pathway for glycerol catabolism used under microaerobic conditions [Geotrichum candidum]
MSFKTNSLVKLNSGHSIPIIGFGLWQTKPSEAIDSVFAALEAGYRHIDSAKIYGNERDAVEGILRFLEKPGQTVMREDIFYTTKIWNADQGYEKGLAAIDEALDKLSGHSKEGQTDRNIGYIDLLLIHNPVTSREKRLGTWKALQEGLKTGKIKSIGVSNYGIPHLEELFNWEGQTITPAVNQLELHPWLQRTELVEYLRNKNILPVAYSPLTRGQRFDDPKLVELTKRYNKSPAQILVKWSIQAGFVPLPKSTHPQRIKDNIDIDDFELSAKEVEELGDKNENGFTVWDPIVFPVDVDTKGSVNFPEFVKFV